MMHYLTFTNLIDVVLVALILFYVFRLLRKSGAVYLFWGIFAFIIAWFLSRYVFHLRLTGALFDNIVSVGAIAIIVIFQSEIRAFFYSLGSQFGHSLSAFRRFHTDERDKKMMEQVALACQHMSEKKTGALIVFPRMQSLGDIADTGEILDAKVSARLIENIFFKNTPLHDGALLIREGRLESAACILPVTNRQDLPTQYGLRHRAALGMTEKSDAVAVVVSEETGRISVAVHDTIEYVSVEKLLSRLQSLLGAKENK